MTTSSPPQADALELFDAVAQISELAAETNSVGEFYRRGLDILTRHFDSPLGLIQLNLTTETIRQEASAPSKDASAWRPIAEALLLEAQLGNRAFAKIFRVKDWEHEIAILAVPVIVPGHGACGSVALVVGLKDRMLADPLLSELRSLVGLLDVGAPSDRRDAPTGGEEGRALQNIGRSARYGSLHEFAFAITNNLRSKADCDQVCLSLARRRRAVILSISGLDDPNPRSSGTLELRQAQEECLDYGKRIVYQASGSWEDDDSATDFRLHRQWHEKAGQASVASIPLDNGERTVAVLSVRRAGGRGFSAEELDKIQELVAPFGPALDLVRRAGLGVLAHAREASARTLRALWGFGNLGRKLLLVLTLSFLGWFCLGTKVDQRVVTARLASLEVRHLTAPFQGKLVESHVVPGDQVEQGDLLYRLETRELELELIELDAELEVARIEIDQALSAGEVQAASLAQARMHVTEAKRASTLRRIEESSVRAAVAGTILRGDLALRIGQVVPQGEPLYELAPDARLQLELLVPEEAAAEVLTGVEVSFSSNARPESYVRFVVESMQPAAEVIEGKNTFRAKAVSVEPLEDWMRVGMEGVARVDLGERPVWRVALGRVIDFFHQVLWL